MAHFSEKVGVVRRPRRTSRRGKSWSGGRGRCHKWSDAARVLITGIFRSYRTIVRTATRSGRPTLRSRVRRSIQLSRIYTKPGPKVPEPADVFRPQQLIVFRQLVIGQRRCLRQRLSGHSAGFCGHRRSFRAGPLHSPRFLSYLTTRQRPFLYYQLIAPHRVSTFTLFRSLSPCSRIQDLLQVASLRTSVRKFPSPAILYYCPSWS